MERWNGKVAVVTGASAGIGAAIARNLVKQGMIVAGFARRVEKIKEIADCLKDSSDKLHAVECDVTKEESVTVAFAWIKNNLGPISVLVNSAGIIKESSLIDGTLEDWRSVFDVNVLGLCLCTREAVRMMRETADEDAIVIHVNSLAAERVPSVPGFSVYPASKRAITGLAMTLRHELAGTRIRVTNISPGLVATEFMASYSVFSPETMAAMPVLNPDDVAAAVIYVLSNPPHVLVRHTYVFRQSKHCLLLLYKIKLK
ncbi:PREDICTED: dehydrogenase/reductase SDR family member 11 isoform X1 [Acromyrmex echinatior]|uniref:dehydrogenase/reductase SDR family member 11 isoform X1 n=1 Tax=Acromyrmex echinatior TaxID=103372 RepID=UPI000580F128|nr:PREDICTED: dehydrogenase/reductase SDR family member 11 isoform X1 [Acromyrmex echinatior]